MPPFPIKRSDIYVPQTYWQHRGDNFNVGIANVKKDIEHLATWLGRKIPASVLDVGSGWGRVYLELLRYGLVDPSMYYMVDFVDSMRKHCGEKTGIMPDPWDGTRLPYSDNAFDAVLSIEVMLHVPPTDIKLFISEHVRVAHRWIYIITAGITQKRLARHCFNHDYFQLFGSFNLQICDTKVTGGGKTMHWALEKG